MTGAVSALLCVASPLLFPPGKGYGSGSGSGFGSGSGWGSGSGSDWFGFGVAAVAGAYLQAEVVDLEAPRLAEEAEVLACSPRDHEPQARDGARRLGWG